jgi:NADPH:quinone reductase-like Zn-dependent oxidoreductase
MTTMLAMATDGNGAFIAINIERPTPGPTEVLIKTAAVGVNPVDWKTGSGHAMHRFFPKGGPVVLGWDVAGIVVEAGAGVTRFSAGDRVFGMPRFPKPAHAYAEFVVAGAREVARIPDNVSDTEAGAVPLAALTAWQSIVDTFKTRHGDRVLIHAASGGVGHLAVQIARARGAHVFATASPQNAAALRELGADHVIDYRTERFEDVATDMDAVLDLVGTADNVERSITALKRGGTLVVVPSPTHLPPRTQLDEAGITAHWILVEPDYAALEAIAAMMETGSLEVVVAATRTLTKMAELHAIGQAGGPMGKLVATVPQT